MARSTDQKTSVARRYVAFPLMLLSVALLAALVFGIQWYTSPEVELERTQVKAFVTTFRELEVQYQTAYQSIFSTRTPLPTSNLQDLENAYLSLEQSIAQYNSAAYSFTLQQTTLPHLKQREVTLRELQLVNQVLAAEETVGTSYQKFVDCRKSVNYGGTAAIVYTKLTGCTPQLQQARNDTLAIPSAALESCPNTHLPETLLRAHAENHEDLLEVYRLSAKQLAKEAAAADLVYKESLKSLNELPPWNTCINVYLQEAGQQLKP